MNDDANASFALLASVVARSRRRRQSFVLCGPHKLADRLLAAAFHFRRIRRLLAACCLCVCVVSFDSSDRQRGKTDSKRELSIFIDPRASPASRASDRWRRRQVK